MRVLSVGNMYPPHHLGGYELMWRSAVRHLRRIGHEVRVLTTDYRAPGLDGRAEEEPDVHRSLRWYWKDHRFPRMGLRARHRLERHNGAVLERHLRELRPDAVAWWAMGGMSLSLIERVRRAGIPAVGMVHDDWMCYGPVVDGWSRVFRRRPLAAVAERLSGIPTTLDLGAAARWLFVSETVRGRALAQGWRLPDTGIAHSGIDHGLFRPAPPRPWRGRLLYVGRIDRRKGVDTAVRAIGLLPDSELTVLGTGDHAYLGELHALVGELGLESRTSFGSVPRDELPDRYADADAVLFPVRWAEPWGLVPLEAMAVGRPVVATGTGGSGEYLRDGENCLLYGPPDDPAELAAAVRRLADDHELRGRLTEAGRVTAGRFGEDSFIREVTTAIHRAVSG